MLICALNARSEFCEAASRCAETAQLFVELNDTEAAAQTWLEGAWAQTCLGNLNAAEHFVQRAARARARRKVTPEIKNRIEWIQARILRDRGEHTAAIRRFETLLKQYKSSGDAFDAARILRELGHTYTLKFPKKAAPFLLEARAAFQAVDLPIDAALCDLWLAQMYRNLNDFVRARDLFASSRATFLENGHGFYAASCELSLGWAEWGLNHFDTALDWLERARDYFQRAGAESEVSSCEINIAGIQSELYRFDLALPILQHALEMARASGRRKKAAVCLESMAWAYDRQGRYAEAIEYYLSARQEFDKEGMLERIVTCDLFLGRVYFNLGQNARALKALDAVVETARGGMFSSYRAEAEMYRGQVLLARGQTVPARRALMSARRRFEKIGQSLYAAFCDRWIATTYARNPSRAAKHLRAARRVLNAEGQIVESAVCDLTQGELEIGWGEWAHAQRHLHRAREILRESCPDLSWRADYGLGQIASARKQKTAALEHRLDAIFAITNIRAGLELEQWSNDLFRARQSVFTETLKLAVDEREPTAALRVIEASKAQLLMNAVMRKDWRTLASVRQSAEAQTLEQQERELRRELAGLRGQLSVQVGQTQANLLRSGESVRLLSAQKLRKLHETSEAYEAVVARLRLMRRGLSGVPALAAFSLDAFREMANARWGQNWTALDYYLAGGKLTTVSIDSETIRVETTALSRYDRFILNACTSTQSDLRELVYLGTLHGQPAPGTGRDYLQALAEKLVPTELRIHEQERVVIVSPHGALHHLPFHALRQGDAFLLDHLTFVYTPALQTLIQLHQNAASAPKAEEVLLVGLDDFGARAQPLRHTAQEIDALDSGIKGNVTKLWQADATRKQFMDWNKVGRLAKFDVLHLATHAVLDGSAPHYSRIFLDDEDLTVLDVMDLQLDARLVTLSACSTALGKGGAGDEILGMVRAFLYAGARALVASLWEVDDKSTGALMQNFYANMFSDSPAGALRAAQLKMRQDGLAPYYWAPFTMIGGG